MVASFRLFLSFISPMIAFYNAQKSRIGHLEILVVVNFIRDNLCLINLSFRKSTKMVSRFLCTQINSAGIKRREWEMLIAGWMLVPGLHSGLYHYAWQHDIWVESL